MRYEAKKITSFTDLVAWKKAHALVVAIYETTKQFPKDERFGLTNQLRRAAVSVSSSIAEGFARSTGADKQHFYTMAHGSLTESQNQLLIARDVGYITKSVFQELAEQSTEVHKLIRGLMKSVSEGKGIKA